MERLLLSPFDDGQTMAGALTALVAGIGENMSVRRSAGLAVSPGVVASYIHNAVAPDLGKIRSLWRWNPGAPQKLCCVSANSSRCMSPPQILLPSRRNAAGRRSRERAIYDDQARQTGKPEAVIAKMVEGRMRKFYEENVLLSQIFVVDGETPVVKVVENVSKELGTPVQISGFLRFAVGEGIDRPMTDFAAEVRATAGTWLQLLVGILMAAAPRYPPGSSSKSPARP